MIRDVSTFIDGRRAGTLSQDRNGRLRYTYDADYPDDATPLSPRLTVPGGEYTHEVAPFIAGLLPDNDQVLDRWGRLFGGVAAQERVPRSLLTSDPTALERCSSSSGGRRRTRHRGP